MKKDTVYSGLDVAKATFDAGLWLPLPEGRDRPVRDIPVRTFSRTREGVRDYLQWADHRIGPADGLSGGTLHAILEHTGRYSAELIAWLLEERPTLRWTMLQPQRAAHYARSLAASTKTDKTDARALTHYGVERRPAGDKPIDPQRAELREMSRYRTTLVEMRTAEGNRAQESCPSPWVRQLQNRRIAQLDRDIQRIEKRMKELIKKMPDLHRDAQYIESIAGVGFVTAVAIVAELGDLRRFARARQLTAFVGVAPRVADSGSSVHRPVHMSKAGDSRLRSLLYMCALSAITYNPHMAKVYQRLTADGKTKKCALGAVMRKLLVLMRALVISGQPYQPDYRPCGKPADKRGNNSTTTKENCA